MNFVKSITFYFFYHYKYLPVYDLGLALTFYFALHLISASPFISSQAKSQNKINKRPGANYRKYRIIINVFVGVFHTSTLI